MSLSYSTHVKSTYNNGLDAEERSAGAYFVKAKSNSTLDTKSFERAASLPVERRIEYVSAVPGEQTYDAVPILGAYAIPL
ncbi:hypothetical protein G7Y89_g3523 [Cudoniella acicularis]|uniref:Uncharacterized protein n=1 Tax=Cudoniella acicularis TaxID=354080 RepID=A0A8H4RSE6_9HELO|nr:hypothetical protein G7Y89_g3523 [Cudoniella acicularis]